MSRLYSRNADFQKFQVLKTNRRKRRRYGEFFVEGVHHPHGRGLCRVLVQRGLRGYRTAL